MKNLIVIMVALVFVCCRPNENTRDIFKWPTTNDTCDSLLKKLDTQYLSFTPIDSVKATLQNLEMEINSSSHSQKYLGYLYYWRGRLLVRQDADSLALKYFKKSKDFDPSQKGYLYHRARYFINYLSRVDSKRQFTDLLSDLNYYEEIGDVAMQAITSGRIGNQLFSNGDYITALRYSHKADSLFLLTKIKEGRLKNNINLSNALYYAPNGDKKQADSLLKLLLSFPNLCLDLDVYKSTLRNAYIHFNDTAALMTAAKISSNNLEEQAIYDMLLGNHYLYAGKLELTKKYLQNALSKITNVDSPIRKAMIYNLASEVKSLEGDLDSVVYYMQMDREQLTIFINKNEGNVLMSIENARNLAIQENEKIHLKHESKLWGIVIISTACAIIALILLYIIRKHEQHKRKRLEYEHEIQRINKNLITLALAIEEKDNIFTSLIKKLSKLRGEGTVKPQVTQPLEAAIGLHLASNEDRKNMSTIITETDSKFADMLKQKHPDLNEYYVKLATFIYLGMETKQIARILMVRPESINQSRWRLRNKLRLSSNDSLEGYLRSLHG